MRMMVFVVASAMLVTGCPEMAETPTVEKTTTDPEEQSDADPLIGTWVKESGYHFEAYTFRSDGSYVLQQGTRTWHGTWEYQDDRRVLLLIGIYAGGITSPHRVFLTRNTADRLCWIEEYDPQEQETCYVRS